MNYQRTTQVPNEFFDTHLTTLSFSELKLYLIIIRQTFGWITKKGHRKQRDRITYSQFQAKTGLSRRVITQTVQSLIVKHLITVSDKFGNLIHNPSERKGKVCIYYAPTPLRYADTSKKVGTSKHKPVHNRVHNKTNTPKLTETKRLKAKQSDTERVLEILGVLK